VCALSWKRGHEVLHTCGSSVGQPAGAGADMFGVGPRRRSWRSSWAASRLRSTRRRSRPRARSSPRSRSRCRAHAWLHGHPPGVSSAIGRPSARSAIGEERKSRGYCTAVSSTEGRSMPKSSAEQHMQWLSRGSCLAGTVRADRAAAAAAPGDRRRRSRGAPGRRRTGASTARRLSGRTRRRRRAAAGAASIRGARAGANPGAGAAGWRRRAVRGGCGGAQP